MSTSNAHIRIEREPRPVQILFHDAVIASTKDALVLTEGSYPPVYYIPKAHVEMAFLHESDRRTTCPHKGEARYWSISAEGYGAENAVWGYDRPKAGVTEIADHVAFYPDTVRIAVGEPG